MSINQLASLNFSNLQKLLFKAKEHFGLFQTYVQNYPIEMLAGFRTQGVIYGGQITLLGGMQIKVAKGSCLFPNGHLVTWDDQTLSVTAGDVNFTRIDRVELAYSVTNGSTVQLTDGTNQTLDLLETATGVVNKGVAANSPTAPVLTTGSLRLGLITVPANTSTLGSSNVSQVEDTALDVSAFTFGNGSKIRGNRTSSSLQFTNDGVIWSALGSGGGGGGGGANWQPLGGNGAIESYAFDEKSWAFSQGNAQGTELFLKVPASFSPGKQIKMKLGHYSPSSSNYYHFTTTATLVRKGVDPINATTNTRVSTNGDVLNTTAYVYTEVVYDLTDSSGAINGVTVSPGDLIKVLLQRGTPSGADDTADVCMVPSLTEVSYS